MEPPHIQRTIRKFLLLPRYLPTLDKTKAWWHPSETKSWKWLCYAVIVEGAYGGNNSRKTYWREMYYDE